MTFLECLKNNLVITLVLITINAEPQFRFNQGTCKFSRPRKIHFDTCSTFHITSNLLVHSSSHNHKDTNVMYRFLSKQNLKKRKKIAINQQVLFLIKYYNKTSRQNKNPRKWRCSTIARNERPKKYWSKNKIK